MRMRRHFCSNLMNFVYRLIMQFRIQHTAKHLQNVAVAAVVENNKRDRREIESVHLDIPTETGSMGMEYTSKNTPLCGRQRRGKRKGEGRRDSQTTELLYKSTRARLLSDWLLAAGIF